MSAPGRPIEPACCLCGQTQTGIALAWHFDFEYEGVVLEELICCEDDRAVADCQEGTA